MENIVTRYLNEQAANGIKLSTLQKETPILRRLNDFIQDGGLECATRQDITNHIISWKDVSENTKVTRKAVIKKFFTWAGKEELVKDLKIQIPKNYLKRENILTTEDINRMIEATDSHAYKALIAILFESGARIGEIRALKAKNCRETDKGLIVAIPTFKTNFPERNVLLPYSAQYIRNYITYTAMKSEEPLFPMYRQAIHIMLQKIKKAAGITKPVSAHKFRHAQATDMVRRGYNESICRKKLGWTPQSQMIARYQHIVDDDVINATLEKSGTEIKHQVLTEIKPAEKLTLADAAAQFSKMYEELEYLKAQVTEFKKADTMAARVIERMHAEAPELTKTIIDEELQQVDN